jgi:hypothetical protein
VCATQTLREDAGGKKSVGGARDRDNGELRFSLRSIQVRQTDVAFCDEMMPFYLFIRPFFGLRCRFIYFYDKNRRHFAKTGSGQTSEIVCHWPDLTWLLFPHCFVRHLFMLRPQRYLPWWKVRDHSPFFEAKQNHLPGHTRDKSRFEIQTRYIIYNVLTHNV